MTEAQKAADGLWETKEDLDRCLAETGVSWDQVDRWRQQGLLPPVMLLLDPYNGSGTLYPWGTGSQVKAAQLLFKKKKRVEYVGRRLWRQGFPVAECFWRPDLQRAGAALDFGLEALRRLQQISSRSEHETLQDRLAQKPKSDVILSRPLARLKEDGLAAGIGVLLNIASGEFENFSAPEESSSGERENLRTPVTRSKNGDDEDAAITALDIGESKNHRVLGRQLKLIDALPFTLRDMTKALLAGDFRNAAEASEEDIVSARDDVLNALKIGASLYEATAWIYGPKAFGLRFVAWLAEKAPDALIDALILAMLRLSEISSAILSSENITTLAENAAQVCEDSQQMRYLAEHDPRFKNVFRPKRIREGFRDQSSLKIFLREIAKARDVAVVAP